MIAAIIKGIALGLLLSVSVGPIIFAIIKQSINHGRNGGYAFILGISASDITIVVVCNSFTAFIASLITHEKIIAICGSIVLLVTGIYSLFFKKPNTEEPHNVKEKVFKKHELIGLSVTGYLMNILNPGSIFFWLAWSTAILADSKGMIHPVRYRFTVFGVCLVVLLATDFAKVLMAGTLRSKLTSKVMHRIDQILGLVLIGFGVALIWGTLEYLH